MGRRGSPLSGAREGWRRSGQRLHDEHRAGAHGLKCFQGFPEDVFAADDVHGNAVLGAMTDPTALEQRDVRELEVGRLSEAAAIELGTALAEARGLSNIDIEQVVRRADGSPFYIGQLLADQREVSGSMASLDRIVDRRIADLPIAALTAHARYDDERKVFEALICCFFLPWEQPVLLFLMFSSMSLRIPQRHLTSGSFKARCQ